MNFNDILVISDLDGTLIDRNFTVSERNRAAIKRFKSNGGHFAIATGRSLEAGARYFAAAEPNCPSIILNGTVIYDFDTSKILWNHPLKLESAKECIQKIHDRFPGTGIEIFATAGLGVVQSNDFIGKHLSREGIINYEPNIFDGRPLCKALIADEAEVIQEIIAFTNTFAHEDVRFVTSSAYFLEMLPAGVDKGKALKRLTDMYHFSADKVYAIGDYYNDVELLSAAGFAAMPQNSPEELKHLADLIVCSCDDGAVADLIEYIEQKVK